MWKVFASAFVLFSGAAMAQTVPPGMWGVTSTIIDLKVPGTPGFLLRMARGKSRTERKCVAAGQGVAALLAPDPKAGCRVDSVRIADGRYAQALTCPQKRGGPLQVSRSGSYDADGFKGQATMTGQGTRGMLHVTFAQRATRTGTTCRG